MYLKRYATIAAMTAICVSLTGCAGSTSAPEVENSEQNTNENEVETSQNSEESQDDSKEAEAEVSDDNSGANENDDSEGAEAEKPSETEVTENSATNALGLYDEILKKVVLGEEMLYGDGEAYEYSTATSPGYALYDINKDQVPELFVTGEMDNSYHSYAIYHIKDGSAAYAGNFNGYIQDEELWIYGFDFLVDAYTYTENKEFKQAWRIEYPFEDEGDITITYGEEGDPQAISDSELDTLSSNIITEPADIEWMPLDEKTTISGNGDSDEKEVSADATVKEVSWNNGEEEYVYPAQNDTAFTFHMSDGNDQVLSANYDPVIKNMEMIDIDNDGEDEYVIYAYTGNTAGDFEFPYIFKCTNGQVVQLFPTKDIPKLAEPTWEGMTRGDVSNTSIVTIEQDGTEKNALEVSLVEKDGGEVKEIYHEILIYTNNHWEEYK